MRKLGMGGLAIGGLTLLLSLNYDTAPTGTYNVGLLQAQLMMFLFGGLLCVLGSVFWATGEVAKRLEAAGILLPSGYQPPSGEVDRSVAEASAHNDAR